MNAPTIKFGMHATYSPEDNKLRLYSPARLAPEVYARVRDAGFKWAPKQQFFVAPMWTPGREDLLIELCGEVGDEDTTLADRAEERADRFTTYSGNRLAEANAAHRAVEAITSRIEPGQPILVGHHSEARARRDAKRIEDGMRKAVGLWDKSEYWTARAAGALRHAKYKERPDVRARRIKDLEADLRKQNKNLDHCTQFLAEWQVSPISKERALRLAGVDQISRCFPLAQYHREPPASQYEGMMGLYSAMKEGVISPEQAQEIATAHHEKVMARVARWAAHYANRIAYEKAMLAAQGGLPVDGKELVPGGRVLVRGEWATIVRVNKKGGVPVSVTTNARLVPIRGVEEIKQYEPPAAEVAQQVASAAKLPPLVNYPGDGFLHMTKAEWNDIHRDYKGSRELGQGAVRPTGYRPDIKNAAALAAHYGRHRVRSVVRSGGLQAVFLSDEKRKEPPPASAEPTPAPEVPAPEPEVLSRVAQPVSTTESEAQPVFETLRDQLANGVQVVSAPQLFPTPAPLAARMVELAGINDYDRILEPSAGTGQLVQAIRATGKNMHVVAVEINRQLANKLEQQAAACSYTECAGTQSVEVICADFLSVSALGTFTAILMNPPFVNAQDIAHIKHAHKMLAEGCKLVAICANGPRQNAELKPYVTTHGGSWEVLPSGTFNGSGTNVETVLLTLKG